MSQIAKIRQQFPKSEGLSDGDLLMAVHKKFYSKVPIKHFMQSADPEDKARFTITDKMWGHWKEQVSRSIDGENVDQRQERLNGSLSEPEVGMGEGIMRSALQGGSMGFGDEIVAGAAAAIDPLVKGSDGDFGERYDRYRGAELDQIDQFRKTNPKIAIASELAGAVAGGGAFAGAGVTAMKGAKTLPTLIKGGVADGTMYGASAGAGYSEGENGYEVAIDTIKGGGTGAILGGFLPVLMSGGSALGRLFKNKLSANTGAPQNQAIARLNQTMQQADISPENVINKLDDLGPEGMLLDALGRPGERLARTTANRSPVAQGVLEGASTQRMSGQSDRLTDRLLSASGMDQPQTIQELQKGIRATDYPKVNEAYKEASSLGYDIDIGSFSDIFSTGMGRKAFDKGVKLAKQRMINEGVDDMPSTFDVLDGAKKALDDMAVPDMGKSRNNEQLLASDLSKIIRNRIDEYMPEYGDARALAQNMFKRQDAVELGVTGAKPSSPANYGRSVQSAGPDFQPDIAKGYASTKIDQINRRRETPGVVDSVFGAPRQQQALTASLGSEAQSVRNQIAAEKTFASTHRALTGNSTTARQIGDMQLEAPHSTSALGAMLVQRLGNGAVSMLRGKNEDAVSPILAEVLLGREVPEQITKQVERNPVLQKLFLRALSAQSGGTVAAQ